MPSQPLAWNPANWDVTIHSRDRNTFYQLEPMTAQHGLNCEGPPATHQMGGDYPSHVFICNDHMMTALNASGYGVIYLTPNQMVDFRNDTAVIRWDMSTLRTSTRDWVDVWISPYSEHLQLPLQGWLPDVNGPPRRAVHVYMDQFNGQSVFKGAIYRDFNSQDIPGNTWTSYNTFLTPDASRRDIFELQISRTRVKFGMPAYNFWWIDTAIADLGWDTGVVQLGHHSYTPFKDCTNCGPNTWHWDNVSIQPAIPFTIIKSDRRYVDAANTSIPVRFSQPAPANAHLRFRGRSERSEMSFDGVNWQPVALQNISISTSDRFRPHWQPVPQGIQQVYLRGSGGWWGNDWMLADISLWTQNSSTQPVPTVTTIPTMTTTPVATPTSTPTRVSSPTTLPSPTLLSTSTPTMTRTAVPSATFTPTRTNTPVVTVTPTVCVHPPGQCKKER